MLKLSTLCNPDAPCSFRHKGSDVFFDNVSCHKYYDTIISIACHLMLLLVKYLKAQIQSLSLNYRRQLPKLAA